MKRQHGAWMMSCGLLLWALLPSVAQAHLVNTGLGPFYDGVLHFALTPEDMLPALALSLLAGLRGVRAGRLALLALPAGWLLGGMAGLVWPIGQGGTMLAILSFLALGGLVAADVRLSPGWVQGLSLVVGGLHGYLNGAAMARAQIGLLGVLGIVATLFVLVALITALVVTLRAPAARIAVRVAGSWIAAAGVLLLGWSLRAT